MSLQMLSDLMWLVLTAYKTAHLPASIPSFKMSILTGIVLLILPSLLHCDDDDDDHNASSSLLVNLNSNLSLFHFSPHSPPSLTLPPLHHRRHQLSLGFLNWQQAGHRPILSLHSHLLALPVTYRFSRDLFLYRAPRVVG